VPGRPEDEGDKEEQAEDSVNDRLPVERIHVKHQACPIVAAGLAQRQKAGTN